MVSSGKFDDQMIVRSLDEIGDLTKSFNEMTVKLKSSQEEIEAWNKELEERVRVTTGELTTEKDKFEAVFQHMADGSIVLDEFSRVSDLNSAAEAFVGMEKSVLIGEQILMEQRWLIETLPRPQGIFESSVSPNLKKDMSNVGITLAAKSVCPAYESEELRCWLLPKTQCDHWGTSKQTLK